MQHLGLDGGKFAFHRIICCIDLITSYRICPGRYMAFSSVWIAVASMVAAFDITKAVDDNGNVMEPCRDYLSGLVRSVKVELSNLMLSLTVFIPLGSHCLSNALLNQGQRKWRN